MGGDVSAVADQAPDAAGPAPVVEEAPALDIHKPKPVHSLREFLSEILVIVVGVVIALSGEQLVESFHWRKAVSETREALNNELAFDLGVIRTRREQAPCMARRVSELRAILAAHAAGKPVRLVGAVSQPNFPHLRTSVWETAIADQSISHMPRDLRLRYAALYEGIAWLRDKESAESEAWTRFSQLDDASILPDNAWSPLYADLAHARSLAEKVNGTILPSANGGSPDPFATRSAELGVAAKRYDYTVASQDMVAAFCKPIL